MTYEQAQIAARKRLRVVHKLPLCGESEYIATEAAQFRIRGESYESLRLEDDTGCVVIAAVKDCEVKE